VRTAAGRGGKRSLSRGHVAVRGGGSHFRCVQDGSDFLKSLPAATVGQKPVVANTHEAVGQHVLQEAADEFVMVELQDFVLVVIAIVLVTEANMVLIHGEESVVVDGDLVGVTGKIGDDGLGALEVGLGIDHPLGLHELIQGVIDLVRRCRTCACCARRKAPTIVPRNFLDKARTGNR
jgi:hypothetical protein